MAIVEHRSFRGAARMLDVSPSALSHVMRGLESRLGVRLLNRTTRSVALTGAGERLLNRIRPTIADLDDALADIASLGEQPSGALRITAPDSGAALLIRNILPKFCADHPGIEVEVVSDGRIVDIIASGFDAGIRLLDMVPKDMVAVRLGPATRAILVASPQYLARHPSPTEPQDLMQHQCIRLRFESGALYRWELEKKGQYSAKLDVPGTLVLNKVELAVEAALAGMGIAFVPEHLVIDHLGASRLIRLLEDWCPTIDGYCLYHPSNRHPPTALKLLVDAVRGWERSQSTAPEAPRPQVRSRPSRARRA